MRFAGKTAVVAGGASGIGLAILRGLAREGARVLCADVSDERLAAVAQELPEAVVTRADVTREAEVEAMMGLAVERFGGLDCSFHVAGASRPGYLVDLSEQDWDFTTDLCLKGVFLCMKHAARHMLGRGGGAMVNIASLNAHVPMHAGAAYASAKAGVEMLTKNGALEWGAEGVRVNAVLPGLVQTPLTKRHFDNQAALDAFLARIPLGRAAQPEDIAGPALFLASEEARYVSGASLLVDGAWAVSGYPDMRPFRGAPGWPKPG
ncbi:SDR family NAD(P)-dependent oxidoreductase [Paracraurococcus ruber]|uniref:Short-chain dehydrogenase n=1 Tax=Paracraurococcus ruber TaxID=77675 RepID=A0ABS1CU76_9PROT|nr:SDR family NAD(P)-dependent oxidoreductase [Paracraurococcus ruber]MBK1657756.1 short-chain dehydrogenase [Paracraurococcus ruber]TDG30524.1 SDR family oxidoreductase [Paracraurococcus ruber]